MALTTTTRATHYIIALWLAAGMFAAELLLLFYSLAYRPDLAGSASARCYAALIIVFGLWALSRVFRYLGAAWLLFAGGYCAYLICTALLSGKAGFTPALVWMAVFAVLSFTLCWLLLFSKAFGTEFAERRKAEPKYKSVSRKIGYGVVGVAAAIATAHDIVHLAQ
jgi:hypothetical protein